MIDVVTRTVGQDHIDHLVVDFWVESIIDEEASEIGVGALHRKIPIDPARIPTESSYQQGRSRYGRHLDSTRDYSVLGFYPTKLRYEHLQVLTGHRPVESLRATSFSRTQGTNEYDPLPLASRNFRPIVRIGRVG